MPRRITSQDLGILEVISLTGDVDFKQLAAANLVYAASYWNQSAFILKSRHAQVQDEWISREQLQRLKQEELDLYYRAQVIKATPNQSSEKGIPEHQDLEDLWRGSFLQGFIHDYLKPEFQTDMDTARHFGFAMRQALHKVKAHTENR